MTTGRLLQVKASLSYRAIRRVISAEPALTERMQHEEKTYQNTPVHYTSFQPPDSITVVQMVSLPRQDNADVITIEIFLGSSDLPIEIVTVLRENVYLWCIFIPTLESDGLVRVLNVA